MVARVRGAAIGGWAELHWARERGLPRAASRDFAFFFGWVTGGCRQSGGGSGGEDGVEVEVEVVGGGKGYQLEEGWGVVMDMGGMRGIFIEALTTVRVRFAIYCESLMFCLRPRLPVIQRPWARGHWVVSVGDSHPYRSSLGKNLVTPPTHAASHTGETTAGSRSRDQSGTLAQSWMHPQ